MSKNRGKSGKSTATRARRPRGASGAASRSEGRPTWLRAALLLAGGVVLVAGALLVGRSLGARMGESAPAAPRTIRPIGGGDRCRAAPRFVDVLGVSDQASFSTSQTDHTGLVIVDPNGDGGKGSVYQHPSWTTAGHLGPIVTDRHGNMYTAATPLASLESNPPSQQNRVYRIDTDTQEMTVVADLPPGLPLTEVSPVGVVGLAYDCDTDSLYASSLAGSTAEDEVGRIFQIDLRRGVVASQLDALDAAGLAVFNGAEGKRLYFGPARAAEVRSVALDDNGAFTGDPRTDILLAGLTKGDRTTVRRIVIADNNDMELRLASFRAPQVPGVRAEDVLKYTYDGAADAWRPAP